LRWINKENNKDKIEEIVKKFNITQLQAKLILNRGLQSVEDIKKYLYGSLKDLHPPHLLKNIEKGIKLIHKTLESKEKITIYGDYDADGITSTVVAVKALENLGANIDYYIPNRLTEGYGMNKNAIQKLKNSGTKLIITVDNGIASINEIEFAKKLGIKTIITDHHNCPEQLPNADVIINPKQNNDNYPNKDLCGCALIWKVMEELYRFLNKDVGFILNLLPLVAISTVADVVDLLDENRILVKEGLKRINSKSHSFVGLNELIKALDIGEVSSQDIGFKIAPCINADGRLKDSQKAIKLFLCNDEREIKKTVKELIEINEERKNLTSKYFQQAEERIKKKNLQNKNIIVLFLKNIPEGIIGLIAGKIKELYQVPTFVFTEGINYYTGSGRGVEGHPLDLFTIIQKTKKYWVKGGGHEMACGISIEKNIKKLIRFVEKVNEIVDEKLKGQKFVPALEIDEEINDLSEKLCNEINILEPTGKANPKPMFVAKNLDVLEAKKVGDGTHISFKFSENRQGIAFGMTSLFAEKLDNPQKIRVVYTPAIDIFSWTNYRGEKTTRRTIKMYIEDIQKEPESNSNGSLLISSCK